MEIPRFTILHRDTEWDFPEINILLRSIKDLIFQYDKAPGTIVIPGEYSRQDIINALGYGTFEHRVVEGFGDIPPSLVPEACESLKKGDATA